MDFLTVLRCPVCGGALSRAPGEGSVSCDAGHSFDVSRAGYVNLLPPGKGRNARTGDDRGMVRARTAFLSLGHYAPISDRLAGLLGPRLRPVPLLCDMGCGEGYHTVKLAAAMKASVIGFDASKTAAEEGCRRAKREGFLSKDGIGAEETAPAAICLPGNLFRLPVRDHVFDAAVSLFAPVAGEESKRILRPGGLLAVVSSGERHLIELRRLIFEEVRLNDTGPVVPPRFRPSGEEELTYSVELGSREEVRSLFEMTPFYYKTTEAGRDRLSAAEKLTVTVNVRFSFFEVI